MPDASFDERVRQALHVTVDEPAFIAVGSEAFVRRARRRQARTTIGLIATVAILLAIALRSIPILDRSETPAKPVPTHARADGTIAYSDGSNLYFTRPDGTRKTIVSDACQARCWISHLSWSPDGSTLLFTPSGEKPYRFFGKKPGPIYAVNADGSGLRRFTACPYPMCSDAEPVWSRDGSRIAFIRHDTDRRVWVMNADGSDPLPISEEGVAFSAPSWSSDGTRIAYSAGWDPYSNGGRRIEVINLDGSGRTVVASAPTGKTVSAPSFSPRGDVIAFEEKGASPGATVQLWLAAADGAGAHQWIGVPGNYLSAPVWSPDGSRIATLLGHRSRRVCIAFIGQGCSHVIDLGAWGTDLTWSPSGTSLAVVSANHLVTVDLGTSEISRFGPAQGSLAWQASASSERDSG